LRARHWLGQQAEAAIAVAVLNRVLITGRPKSVRTFAVATKFVVGLRNLDFVRLRATTPLSLASR
jgi:hypothetical protein